MDKGHKRLAGHKYVHQWIVLGWMGEKEYQEKGSHIVRCKMIMY